MESLKSPSKNLSKKGWLDYLYYKTGRQQTNFFVCGTYSKGGKIGFTKWKTYLDSVAVIDLLNHSETWEERKYFEAINQRQILPNEIVLDIEIPDELNPILDKIKAWGWKEYFVFKTGSKGFHIHLFFNRDMKIKEKEAVVKNLDTDIQKCNEKNLIALEYCPHWRTGKLKEEIEYE